MIDAINDVIKKIEKKIDGRASKQMIHDYNYSFL